MRTLSSARRFRDKLPVAVRRVNAVHKSAWSSQTQCLLAGYGVTAGHGFCSMLYHSSSFRMDCRPTLNDGLYYGLK